MKNYSFFRASYWNDETFRQMSPEQKAIMFYLFTGTMTNWCGIFKVSIQMMGFYIGLREDNMASAFDGFLKKYNELVAYDYETGEVALLNWASMNWVSANKRAMSIAETELQSVESLDLLNLMVKKTKYSKHKELYLSAARSFRMSKLNESLHSPLQLIENEEVPTKEKYKYKEKEYCAVSTAPPTCDNDCKEQIESQAKSPAADYEMLRTSEGEPDALLDKAIAIHDIHPAPPDGFNEVWDLYSFKRNKPDAEKAYSKLSKKDRENLRPGIEAYLEYLKHPDNAWRQQKLLGSFLRGRMWEDDWSLGNQPVRLEPLGEHEEGFMKMKKWVLSNYPNLSQLDWLTLGEYLAVKNREPDFCGAHWRLKATERAMYTHIIDSFRELNDNPFVRKNYTRVYAFLKESIRKKLYA